jgi:hypothetical protein
MTATLAPTLTARERKTRLSARLKTLEAQANEAVLNMQTEAADAFISEWHAVLAEWMRVADDVEAERRGR